MIILPLNKLKSFLRHSMTLQQYKKDGIFQPSLTLLIHLLHHLDFFHCFNFLLM
nr:MAG TPA: hypothetical protein [Caudoviricetes sp.]